MIEHQASEPLITCLFVKTCMPKKIDADIGKLQRQVNIVQIERRHAVARKALRHGSDHVSAGKNMANRNEMRDRQHGSAFDAELFDMGIDACVTGTH